MSKLLLTAKARKTCVSYVGGDATNVHLGTAQAYFSCSFLGVANKYLKKNLQFTVGVFLEEGKRADPSAHGSTSNAAPLTLVMC